jgi:hypothetical protein
MSVSYLKRHTINAATCDATPLNVLEVAFPIGSPYVVIEARVDALLVARPDGTLADGAAAGAAAYATVAAGTARTFGLANSYDDAAPPSLFVWSATSAAVVVSDVG